MSNPPVLILFSANHFFLVFLTFQQLRDSKKGKVRGHASEILTNKMSESGIPGDQHARNKARGAPSPSSRATYALFRSSV
jgi:hypothetical protein